MSAREIIARAYDREDAAQMGEPDPWAEEVSDIVETGWRNCRLACAEAAIEALTAAGYRILGPDDLTNLKRPITQIEYRTGQEAFDIMCDRLRALRETAHDE